MEESGLSDAINVPRSFCLSTSLFQNVVSFSRMPHAHIVTAQLQPSHLKEEERKRARQRAGSVYPSKELYRRQFHRRLSFVALW